MLRSRRQLIVALPFAAAVSYQAMRWWTVTQFFRIDFSVYYGAVSARGISLYDYRFPRDSFRFNYPPFAALLLRPLTILSYEHAEYVWLVVSVVCASAFAALSTRLVGVKPALLRAAAPAFLMVMVPVTLTLRLGQINALVALLILVDVVLLERDHRAAGVGTGLSAALKVTPAFVIVAFAVGQRSRAAAVALATFATTVALSALVFPADTWRYWTAILWDTRRVGGVELKFNQRQADGFPADFSNAMRRPISWLPGSPGRHTAMWIAASVLVGAVALARSRRAFARRDELAAVTITACAGYLLAPITWAHHLFFGGVAVVMLASRDGWWWKIVAVAGAFVMTDPIEGGEGAYYSLARIVFLLIVAVFMPHTTRGHTRYRETPSAARSA